jgi:hypothetical protein
MTLGMAHRQGDILDDVVGFFERLLPENSIYALLHRERDRLFPDESFADLFTDRGRRSVPPSTVATVMVLQRLEGLSDREAVERYTFDARWRHAAGVGGYGSGEWDSFSHTVLVDMRERLRRSDRPDRIFEVALQAASAAGLIGRRRVLDSTPLYDAVATMDTVTLIRSAIRGLLKVAGRVHPVLAAQLRGVLARDDDYTGAGKPVIDWDDRSAREELVDALAKDAHACLLVLDGRDLAAELADPLGPDGAERAERAAGELTRAGELLATVTGQDLEQDDDGVFRIARRVAPDRVISTVDPQARHGHKTSAHGFDGYKGHIAADPDSEIITATTVTPGNTGDAAVAENLVADLLDDAQPGDGSPEDPADATPTPDTGTSRADPTASSDADDPPAEDPPAGDDRKKAYGDAAYGTGEFQAKLEGAGIASGCKTQPPVAPGGRFAKDRFAIDTAASTVRCPAGQTVTIRRHTDGGGTASFGTACAGCPLAEQCTTAASGRTITIGPHEDVLTRARARQADPAWIADYRATRPKVERKLAHLTRRRHGGRRARVRGQDKVGADFRLLAAAVNLARLAARGLFWTPTAGWAVAG